MAKALDTLDHKGTDLITGLGALLYTILVVILREAASIDLAEYLAQPQVTGPFALVALGRWYAKVTHERAGSDTRDEPESSEAEDDKPEASPEDSESGGAGEPQSAEERPQD